MRWPLRNQILVRMLMLLIVSISILTAGFIRSRVHASRLEEQAGLDRVIGAVERFRFPLTSSILDSIHDLSGVEIAVTDGQGKVREKSRSCPDFNTSSTTNAESERDVDSVEQTQDGDYYHISTELLQQFEQSPQKWRVHLFYPRRSLRSILWEATLTPLYLVLIVVPFAVLLSYAAAANVTRPIGRLKKQIESLGQGELQELPPFPSNDEIFDLSQSFNEMAKRLQDHEAQLQQNARLQAMLQFGASTAHNLRNSATGIKMAIDLLAANSPGVRDSDNFHVAHRQLKLMDSHIKKFLIASKPTSNSLTAPRSPVFPSQVLTEAIELLQPMAEHLKVQMTATDSARALEVLMLKDDLQQLMLNLIGNAIEAAASQPDGPKIVSAYLTGEHSQFTFTVNDSGPGPPPELHQDLFEPFVTGKPEGTGLGLFVVKEIAERNHASITWSRSENQTVFTYQTNKELSQENLA